jgi:hypothetical protein
MVNYTRSALKKQPLREDRQEIALRAGLCAHCRWLRILTNGRSRFVFCGLSQEDSRFSRYPSLPVRFCGGYQEEGADVRSEGPEEQQGPAGRPQNGKEDPDP